MIKLCNYTDRNTQAYRVDLGKLIIWFSYETPIAFEYENDFFISQNEWSNTTGRHLNEIDEDKSNRISHSELMEKLNNVLNLVIK